MSILLKKFVTAIILLGVTSISSSKAVSYSHRLTYTNDDNAGTAFLQAVITFEDTSPLAQQDTTGLGDTFDDTFTTTVSYVYRPEPNGTVYTLNTSDFSFYQLQKSGANIDYSGDLASQISNIQFTNTSGGSGPFFLTMNGEGGSSLQARLPGATANDFSLLRTTQFPAPLPLLGILPAVSSFRRLKKRYNLINK